MREIGIDFSGQMCIVFIRKQIITNKKGGQNELNKFKKADS